MTPHTNIGETSHGKSVLLTRDERLRHMAIFGSTGVGKTTFLLNIVAQDIARGDGLLVIDPHGDFAAIGNQYPGQLACAVLGHGRLWHISWILMPIVTIH